MTLHMKALTSPLDTGRKLNVDRGLFCSADRWTRWQKHRLFMY